MAAERLAPSRPRIHDRQLQRSPTPQHLTVRITPRRPENKYSTLYTGPESSRSDRLEGG